MWRTPHCLEKEEHLVVSKLDVVRAITMGFCPFSVLI